MGGQKKLAKQKEEKTSHPVDRYVGLQLRHLRRTHGLSQQKLGDRLGMTFQQLQKYEKGTNRLCCSRLYEIARELDTPLTYFFEGYEEGDPALVDAPVPARRDSLYVTQLFDQIKDERLRKTFSALLRSVVQGEGGVS